MEEAEGTGTDTLSSVRVGHSPSLSLHWFVFVIGSGDVATVHGGMQLSQNHQVQLISAQLCTVPPGVHHMILCEL